MKRIRHFVSKRVILMPWVSGTMISTVCHAAGQDDMALTLYQDTRDHTVTVAVSTSGRHPRIEVLT